MIKDYVTLSFAFVYSLSFYVTPTAEIYTLSLHDALPISPSTMAWIGRLRLVASQKARRIPAASAAAILLADRKSTRLNSSHVAISYAVFCLKKKMAIYAAGEEITLSSNESKFNLFPANRT